MALSPQENGAHFMGLTKTPNRCIMSIEKGKTISGYAKDIRLLKNNAKALTGWRYFFMVNANNSNKIIINVIM